MPKDDFPHNWLATLPIRPEFPEPMAPLVNTFTLGAEESFLFDLWAQEHSHILGVEIEFWSLDVESSKRDPLYDEPIERVWEGPFKLKGYIEWPDSTPEAREEGMRTTWSASAWISRKDFEDAKAPPPSEGDVFRVWNIPFFQGFGVDDEKVPGRGYFFDILNVNDDGHLWDQANFVGYSFTFTRRTEYTPERRLENK
jgi:hypothetical protein